MYPPYPPEDSSFTIHPPYNPTDLNFFDSFAYYPSDAVVYLGDPLPSDWAHYQSTNVQDFNITEAEYPYVSSMHYPLHTSFPPEQFVPLFPDPRADNHTLPTQFVPFFPDPSPDNQAVPEPFIPLFPDPSAAMPYSLDQPPTACDLNTILNFPDRFPEFFAQPEYCEEFYAPQPTAIVASDVIELSESTARPPPPVKRSKAQKSRAAPRIRARPAARSSGFVPSDPDDLSSYEKKRLYAECLEHYVQYLHQLFAWINVQPVPLERVSSYRELASRSMRTILLHLGKSADILHGLIIHEEEKFKDLKIREVLGGAHTPTSESPDDTAASPASDSTASSTDVSSDADAEISKSLAEP
ncbi:hypothetical protein B0H19DRAFT_631219 [Mycena capillaripes]|nr:hypothetical protein B0H19DRAFT_631219 [Mycena capillaripes]